MSTHEFAINKNYLNDIAAKRPKIEEHLRSVEKRRPPPMMPPPAAKNLNEFGLLLTNRDLEKCK